MHAQGSGHMILLGSTSGHAVSPLGGVYSATKFAIRAIADSLHKEGGTAIRTTLISPGATQTEIVDHVGHEEMTKGLLSIRPMALTAMAVAEAIAYAMEQPPEVDVSEILLRPIFQKD
jgi:NADP-dependent 3-hydroxy acid dehydrogenase YdfG